MRSHLSNPAYDDDGISSSEEEQDDEDAAEEEDDDEDLMPHLRHLYLSPSRLQDQVQEPESETALPSPLAPLDLTLSAQAQSEEPEPETIPPTTIPTIIPILTTPSTMPNRRLPKLFLRRNHHDVHAPPHADHTHRRSSSAGAIPHVLVTQRQLRLVPSRPHQRKGSGNCGLIKRQTIMSPLPNQMTSSGSSCSRSKARVVYLG